MERGRKWGENRCSTGSAGPNKARSAQNWARKCGKQKKRRKRSSSNGYTYREGNSIDQINPEDTIRGDSRKTQSGEPSGNDGVGDRSKRWMERR